jgi:hypothetical protein
MKKSSATEKDRRPFERLIGPIIFLFVFAIFWLSPIRDMTDSKYAMLTSQTLFKYQTFALDRYPWPGLQPLPRSGLGANTTIYQIEEVRGHRYYYFPPGTTVLSLPYAALMSALGISAANPDDSYNAKGELAIQGSLAALLMAAAAWMFFSLSRLVLPLNWSVLVSLGSTLGTQIWSTASRVMWSDTWAIVLITAVIWLLLSHETGREWTKRSGALLATLLAWSYFVRPTNSIAIVAITIYVIVCRRKIFPVYALTGALWFVALAAYSWHNFGLLLPYYFRADRLHFGQYPEALAGNLISPSRGLLVFVPVLFFVGFLLARYWRQLLLKRLVVLSLIILVGHLLTVAAFVPWHGGGCFGPRYSTGLVPWFVLLAILGLRTMLDHKGATKGYRMQLAAGAFLLLGSIFINARGATAYETSFWNDQPVNIDRDAIRVWDWRYPQFLAGLIPPPAPASFARLTAGPTGEAKLDLTSHEADKFLWYGWSGPEPDFRWTAASEALVIFEIEKPVSLLLKIHAAPFLVSGKVEQQEVRVSLNGKVLTSLVLNEPREYDLSVVLPVSEMRQQNILTLRLPQATSPQSLGLSDDARHLGIAVRSLSFEQPVDLPVK